MRALAFWRRSCASAAEPILLTLKQTRRTVPGFLAGSLYWRPSGLRRLAPNSISLLPSLICRIEEETGPLQRSALQGSFMQVPLTASTEHIPPGVHSKGAGITSSALIGAGPPGGCASKLSL